MKKMAFILTYTQLLQQLHDKLTRKLSPAKAIDPLTIFPVELAEMILAYLSFRHMVNCMRVSKGWRDYLSKLSKLWMHIDLSGARKPVPRSFVNKAVKRSQDRVSRITIHRFEHVDMLKNIAKLCKHLADVEIISLPHTMSSTLIEIAQLASNLRRFVIHPEITFDTATGIIHGRPELEHVGFQAVQKTRHGVVWKGGPWPNLKSFELNIVDGMMGLQIGLIPFLAQASSLNSLKVDNVVEPGKPRWHEALPHLRTLEMTKTRSALLYTLPCSLQRLTIENEGVYNLNNASRNLLACQLPHLTHLTLHNFEGINADRLEELLSMYLDEKTHKIHDILDGAALQTFSLRGVLHNDTSILTFITSLITRVPRIFTPALRTLDIATLPCNDDAIETLLASAGLAGLETIDLSYTHITGASIKMLVDQLAGCALKLIRADNCARINGRDAVDYAAGKGVYVSCGMGEGKGGRKVRYG